MKTGKLLYTISLILLMTSCTTTSFYQLYKVEPIDNMISNDKELFYEDDYCMIFYDLWGNGGNIGFDFYNKTEDDIYVKLDESNFILNGYAFDYFKNRTYTSSKSVSSSTSQNTTKTEEVAGVNLYNNIQTNLHGRSSSSNVDLASEYSVSISDEPVIRIPPISTKRISEYSINSALIRNCDLLRYPRKKDIKTKSYTMDKSPIVFSNRISYEINGETNLVENKFYVSEITNYPKSAFFESEYEEFCDQKSKVRESYFRFYSIDKFYISYQKGTDSWKH